MRTKEAIKSVFAVLITLMVIVLVMQLDIPSSETRGESSVVQAYPIGTMTPTPPPFTPGPWPTASPPVVTATPIPVSPTPTPPLSDRAQQALRYVSQTYNVPIEHLMFLIEAIGNYPLTGRTIWQGKILDRASHQVYMVGIDEAGQIVDPETIKQAEEDAAFQQYGKLEPALYDRLQTLGDEDRVKVSIWLSGVDEQQIMNSIAARYPEAKLLGHRPSKETDMGLYSQIEAEMMAAKKQAYLAIEGSVIAFLEARGFSVIGASQSAPLIFAELPKRVILELVDRIDVSAIYLSKTAHLTLESAIRTDRAQSVWQRGITGSDRRVAVIENNGVDFGHNALVDGLYYNPDNPNIWGEDGHATHVAGAIASTDETRRGVAYGGPGLLSANASSFGISDIIAATEWAIGEGPNTRGEYLSPSDKAWVLNNSWAQNSYGTIDAYARYYDHVVYHHFRTVVAGTGNDGTWVKSPALAYNVIAVGAIDDSNTSSWSDDQMWSFSDHENPGAPWGDREKPEVVAVGVDVTTTHPNNGWATVPGTSVAAPQVSGLASLLIQRKDTLRAWPEAIKAIMMASAVHNIENPSVPIPGDGIDDRDGAGAIDAALADTIAKNGWYMADWLLPPPPANGYFIFEALAGEKVRVVIVWDSHPDNNHPPSTDPLKSNLDLLVYKPGDPNTPIAYSVSSDNNYEIVEFTAPQTGEYTIEVAKITFEDPSEWLTVAWVRTGTYLPDIKANYNGWTSELVIRNDGATSRHISTHFFDQNGDFVNALVCPNVPSGGTCSFSASIAVNNFSGSAIVDGSEDVSVVVKENQAGYSSYAYNGIAAADSLNPGWGQAGTTIHLPLLMDSNGGWSTSVTILNTSTSMASFDLDYFGQNSGGPYQGPQGSLGPNESATYLQLDSFCPTVGAGRIISDQPLAVIVREYSGNVNMAYNGFSAGATTVSLPLIMANNYGWYTGIAVQNLGSAATNITVNYYPSPGFSDTAYNVQPNATAIFVQSGGQWGSTRWVGSARVTASQPIAAIVNQTTTGKASSYSGFANGSGFVVLPDIRNNHDGWTSGVQVQNLDSASAHVVVRVSGSETWSGWIEGYKSVTLNPVPGTWSGFRGPVTLECTNGRRIAAIVNTTGSGAGDLMMTYNGINR